MQVRAVAGQKDALGTDAADTLVQTSTLGVAVDQHVMLAVLEQVAWASGR